jgi:hypothetical protein
MAATAHLTAVAPDNEKCTVQSAPARLPRRRQPDCSGASPTPNIDRGSI